MKKLLQVSLCFLMLCVTHAFAQNRTVTGTVTAKDDGLPIPGVTVKVKGTQAGSVSGSTGNYSISAPSGATLVFSFIGYETLEVPVTGGVVNVTLAPSSKQLTEVVVTGVGVATEKRRVPIDVASVSGANFGKTTTTDIQQGLQGQIAGASIQQNSGQPNSGYNIILRGITNLNGGQPIILVDGVQIGGDASSLDNLDPSNVDHVEVVKGAAGGMLYGAQGANGVIQIFTKKGSLEKPLQINISSKLSVDNILKAHDLTAKDHHWVTDANGNILNANGDILKPDSLGFWANPDEEDPTSLATINNKPYKLKTYDHLAQGYRTAHTYNNSVNFIGGGEKVDYSFTASRMDQQDVFSNNYNRDNLSLNLGIQLAKGLTFRSSTQAILSYDNLLGGNRFNLVNSYPYINFLAKGADGLYIIHPKDENQPNSLSERGRHTRENKETRILQDFDLNYKFPKFVELDYKYGVTTDINDGSDFYTNQSLGAQPSYFWGPNLNGYLEDDYSKEIYQNSLASLYFKTDFKNDFGLNIPIRTVTQVSYDYRNIKDRSYFASGSGLQLFPPYNLNSVPAAGKSNGDNSSEFTTFGILVNQTIEYANLVGISGGFRSDYSSEFGEGSKPFTFPRGTIFFNPSELFHASFIDNWKLRAAYGEAGIQPLHYTRQPTLYSPDRTQYIVPGSLSVANVGANPDLVVQKSKELETGTDITFLPFKGDWLSRLTLSGTYWNRKSQSAIGLEDLALSTGIPQKNNNLADISEHGVDISLDATVLNSENFTWNLGLKYGFARSTVTKIYNGKDIVDGLFIVRQGQSVGEFYGQQVLHSLSDKKPDGTPYIAAADAGNYQIVNGNVVNSATGAVQLTAPSDLRPIGNSIPNFNASLINSFTLFKQLTLSFQFDWVHGNKIYNESNQYLYRDRISADFDKPVTINGKSAAYVSYYNALYNGDLPVSWFVEDGSYIRLRDLSLTYDLSKVVKVKWLRRLAVTAGARNLVTFTKYKGLDPENTAAVNSQGVATTGVGAVAGVDYFGVPNLRSYQFGINIGL